MNGPVAIFGGGVSGDGVRRLLDWLGISWRLFDRAGEEFTPAAAAGYAAAVYSPGFAPEHPWLQLARRAGIECWGELDFAARFWRGRIVAVTGTNGKTTLTELLVHALRAIGRAVYAAGNIGEAFSGLVAQRAGGDAADIAVCEVSSFQAETLRHFRAEATLWTNFAEDHLERHASMADYFRAKAVLAARSDLVIAGPSVRAIAGDPPPWSAPTIWVGSEAAGGGSLAGTVFAGPPQSENFALASAWWKQAGLPAEALPQAARTFRLGRHRLTQVGVWQGITFWNDSKATNFHAVEAALQNFDRPVLLIAGGKSKGGDIAGFVARIRPRVRMMLIIGETGDALEAACRTCGVAQARCASLANAVEQAVQNAGTGDHVLLSPGFASFDQFRNYQDRGEQFESLLSSLTSHTNPSPR